MKGVKDYMICTNCGNKIPDGAQFCTSCGASIAPQYTPPTQNGMNMNFGPAPQQPGGVNMDFNGGGYAPPVQSRRKEYKVLSQKDKWFSGKFDPATLEQAINSYAQQGWRLVCCATADIPAFGSTRQEFIAILERDV